MMQFRSMQSRLTMIFIGISLLTMLILGAVSVYGAVQENHRLIREYRRDMEESAKLQLEWQTHSALSVVNHCYQAQLRGGDDAGRGYAACRGSHSQYAL